MKFLFKKVLVNILVLMVVMLPLRNVFAMSMEMSSNHCVENTGDTEMSMMSHAGHKMPALDPVHNEHEKEVTACTCCNQCDGDCTGCVHISSAITFELLQLSDLKIIELVYLVSDSLLTRTISPPSRPPLIL